MALNSPSPQYYTVRDLEKEDLQKLLKLLGHLTEAPSLSDETLCNIFEQRKAHRVVTKVAEDNQTKELIGTASLVVEPKFFRGGRSVAHIEDVVTDSNHRVRGVGHQLLQAMIASARENDCYKIILDCSDELVPFYEKKGFRPSERQMRLDLPSTGNLHNED